MRFMVFRGIFTAEVTSWSARAIRHWQGVCATGSAHSRHFARSSDQLHHLDSKAVAELVFLQVERAGPVNGCLIGAIIKGWQGAELTEMEMAGMLRVAMERPPWASTLWKKFALPS
jgi:hypothetical protein